MATADNTQGLITDTQVLELSRPWPDICPLSGSQELQHATPPAVTLSTQAELQGGDTGLQVEATDEKQLDFQADTGVIEGLKQHTGALLPQSSVSTPASPSPQSSFNNPHQEFRSSAEVKLKDPSRPAEEESTESHTLNIKEAAPGSMAEDSAEQPSSPCDTSMLLIKAEAAHTSEVITELDAQQIVVLREDAHWSDLNQSYFLQQEDGTVCQAAIQGGIQEELELDSQPVEVYEFCGLVEEVAEETICGASGGGVHIPHSPGYEVNLFNALLENSNEFTIKEDLEGDTIIISQQHLPTSSDSSHMQPCSSGDTDMALAVEQRLVLDSDQAVELSHSGSGLCLVQVAGECFVTEAQTGTSVSTIIQNVSTNHDVTDGDAAITVTHTQNQPVLSLTAEVPDLVSKVETGTSTPTTEEHPKLFPLETEKTISRPPSPLTHVAETMPHQGLGPISQSEHASDSKDSTQDLSSPTTDGSERVATPNDPICPGEDEEDEEEEEEEESEDQEQEETAEMEAQEENCAPVSSAEEGSDEEADQSETTTSSSQLKLRQWIADRVGSSSISPVPSSDWSRREKPMLLRGPHGKFVSPSSVCGFSSSSSPTDLSTMKHRGERHADMAELAKHEADIEHRTQALKREGFWSTKRLTRLAEPQRPKVHWEYLCEEMQWLSADFAQERRWKRGVARKVVRMVMRHHEDLRQKEEKAKRDEHAKIRRVASSIAKEVRSFWSNVEKVVQYKQQSRLEEKRKKALDLQLDFIVGQTEKYSDLLSKSLAPSRPVEPPPTPQTSQPPHTDEEDRDFEPPCEEEDDEETIEVEEQQDGNDAESHRREIELLKEEGLLPLDQLLSTLTRPQDSEEDASEEMASSEEEEDDDREFKANDEDAEDEEDTIAAQEKVEGNVDHTEELDDLAKEGDMSMEELLEKYKGAYASDAEPPSASASKASSESEVSGDEEVETDEDESDVESNSSSSESAGDSAEGSAKDEDSEEEECGDEGTEVLLKEGDHSPTSSGSRPKKEISHITATAESLQPKGYTLATTKVKTPIPFLLHGTLREYQHIGLDWLVTMFEKKLNGILADEMGLGKTIQTIALLAHLACEKGNWGPHLIIVPTSVMLNWEMELKRWCPGFKILTYFGSQKERKLKRQGWTKPNAFHVCITSYKLVLQDHQAFRRKSWRYLILDEAQNIKNFKSQRWQSLLNFNSHRRLLLTGTPLQNSLMELWSLMHFLMPHVFQSHREFKEWFSNPLTGMIEGSQEYNEGLVKRLHKVLRPFLLRRIKADVEKQMPKKYEHVVRCRLSKRQRFLYDDFMAQASTRETLASGHFMSVINILMQLRKVCNHPNLFDPRPIQSAFITQPIVFLTASLVQDVLDIPPLKRCDLSMFDLLGLESQMSRYQVDVFLPCHKVSRQLIQEIVESPEPPPRPKPVRMKVNRMFQPPPKADNRSVLLMNKPSSSYPPAAQADKSPPLPPPAASEAASTSSSAPAVQQVVCSVAPTPPPPRPLIQTAVRSSAPKPVLTVRPPAAPGTAAVPAHPSPNPSSVMPQRVLLSPDMQARLPSGEVVSIAQLASLAGRPVSSCQGSKPVTFQLQGNKLTLSGAQIHQVPAAAPRPVQGNVMHLVSSGVQHHILSQPTQVTIQSVANTHPAHSSSSSSSSSAAPAAGNRLPVNSSSQVPSSAVSSPGVVKIVVRQTAGKEGGPVPTLAVAPSPRGVPQTSPSHHPPFKNTASLQLAHRTPGPATAHYTLAPPRNPSSTPRPQPSRPVLKVVQPPPSGTEQPAPVTPPISSSSTSKCSTSPRDLTPGSQTSGGSKPKPAPCSKACAPHRKVPRPPPRSPFYTPWLANILRRQRDGRLDMIFSVNERRCSSKPVFGREVLDLLTFLPGPRPTPAALSPGGHWSRSGHSSCLLAQESSNHWLRSPAVGGAILTVKARLELLSDVIDRFTFVIPPVEAPPISMHCCHPPPSLRQRLTHFSSTLATQVAPLTSSLHRIQSSMRTQFPDLRLIQYDCGKLQTLHTLLRKLKTGGHRVLIFTQMTRMLDVLEQFLNYHGHIYLRLDGSTRVEQRQALMERFNADRRIFCFILSTRSGGVGVNLTGADTVVFYDSDWNPTMDAQAQDRCHRIGQTRDVHIYRLISERTVEENILKKANQKRMLGDMAIEGGNFTTAFFKEQTIRELFDVTEGEKREVAVELSVPSAEEEESGNKQSTTILEQALCRAEDEEDIVAASQAKAEQVAELAEFNENIPLDEGGEQEEVEELSKAEQEIAALVEQLTPIERYAMNFLEASLEDVCKEELKQAEEQVEAARKGLDQAKEGLKLHASSDDEDDFLSASSESALPSLARRGRKPKDKISISTRTSSRLRGTSPETESEPATPREVPERLRLRGRGATPTAVQKTQSSRESSKSSKASSPARDHVKTRTQPNRSHQSPVPSPPTGPTGGKYPSPGETDCKRSKAGKEEQERRVSDPTPDHQGKDIDAKDKVTMSPPAASSRSPRKRQSADNEILRGLVEDSPSAKVLRKLPGRLVTVVEEKEPRKRRRRGSGTAGFSSEETSEEPSKDNSSPSAADSKTKSTASPQDHEALPSPDVHPLPVRSYPPYSPPHHSPDMPVLRNLPVRRRLETESRMAAQQQILGRLKENQPKKMDTRPGKAAKSISPSKRKRGRPPKTTPGLPETDPLVPPSPGSPGEEGNPPLSPKRKRGRRSRDTPKDGPISEGFVDTTETEDVPPTSAAKSDQTFTVDSAPVFNQPLCVPSSPPSAQGPPGSTCTPVRDIVPLASPSMLTIPTPVVPSSSEGITEPKGTESVCAKTSSSLTSGLSVSPAVGVETPPTEPPPVIPSGPVRVTVDTPIAVEPLGEAEGRTLPQTNPSAPSIRSPASAEATAGHDSSSAAVQVHLGGDELMNHTSAVQTCEDNTDRLGLEEVFTSSPLDGRCSPAEEPKTGSGFLSRAASPTSQQDITELVETAATSPVSTSPPGMTTASPGGATGTPPAPQEEVQVTTAAPLYETTMWSKTPVGASAPTLHLNSPHTASDAQIPAFPEVQKSDVPTCATDEEPPLETERTSEVHPEIEVDAAETEADLTHKEELLESSGARHQSSEGSPETQQDSEEAKGREELQPVEEAIRDQTLQSRKRSFSRQSSLESTCSSTPSSGCSSSTLTRYAHHKKTYENRHPTKRKREEVTAETSKEKKKQGEGEKEELPTVRPGRRSRSTCSSSSSESDGSQAGHRLTRSVQRQLQDHEKDKGRKSSRTSRGSDRNMSQNAGTSTGGELGSDTSLVRMTRKSAGASQDVKAQTNSVSPLPPEPEVLGKRCSALNAAAKLLAMKGRVDTPGHTPRKDTKAIPTSSDKDQKPQSKAVAACPQSNSLNLSNNKNRKTPGPDGRPGSRSTRQCPGSLLPPLDLEYRRPKLEEKVSSSSRGQSACSSMSSDGEADNGRSSRSRSSSNSSRRGRSVGSQNEPRTGSRSGGTSSGSERDRSLERAKKRDDKQGRRDTTKSQRLPQDVLSSSSTEGTPDRILRSVAALAAVQARSPAASTRSSSNQQRLNKT